MKITDFKVHQVVPRPDATPIFPGYRGCYTFVEITTEDGISGLGECTMSLHDGDLIVGRILRSMGASLIGRDASHVEHIWSDLFRKYTYLGSRGPVTIALSGIDTALWDVKGKALGRPVYDLLGGRMRDSVPLYTHPGGLTPQEATDNAVALIERGFTAFKWDPFIEMGVRHTNYIGGQISKQGVRFAGEIIGTVRDAVGPDVEILIDFHGQYNVASALQCIDALKPYDITWFEEPVPPEGLHALRQIRAQTDAALCVGERLHTRWDFVPIFREGLANYVMPDVCWTGGVSELKKIATMAEAHFVPIAPHGANGPLQAVTEAHVVIGSPNLYRLEILGPQAIDAYNRCLAQPLDIRDGHLFLSDEPGLGIDLDWDFVRAHPHPDWP